MARTPALLVLLFGLGGVLLLGAGPGREATRSLDQAFSLDLQAAAHPWHAALKAISFPLDSWHAFVCAALLIGWVARRAGRRAAFFVFAAGMSAAVLVQLAKLLYGHPRPTAPIEVLLPQPITASYPSGHVAWVGSFLAAALWVCLRGRRRGAQGFGALALLGALLLMALSRIYLGHHFATDVVAGALTGLGCVAATTLYQDRPESQTTSPPGVK